MFSYVAMVLAALLTPMETMINALDQRSRPDERMEISAGGQASVLVSDAAHVGAYACMVIDAYYDWKKNVYVPADLVIDGEYVANSIIESGTSLTINDKPGGPEDLMVLNDQAPALVQLAPDLALSQTPATVSRQAAARSQAQGSPRISQARSTPLTGMTPAMVEAKPALARLTPRNHRM